MPETPEDLDLFQRLRQALRSEEPLDLLGTVSGLIEATKPDDPFSQGPPVGMEELVETFIGTPYAETTAALTIIQALSNDDALAEQIWRELAGRRQPMPRWLADLDQARAQEQVWSLSHVLADGDNHMIGATFASGQSISAVVYIDHNMGTVVKDAFLVPGPVDDVVAHMSRSLPPEDGPDGQDQWLIRADPAEARVRVEQAIDLGARTIPPLVTDTWPMCRPVVEWIVRMLPAGGAAPERKQSTEEQTEAIARDFFTSAVGRALDRPDERDLLNSVLWFGTAYGPGDPLRWSPVNVEILLTDWFPRKVIADPEFLAKLPDLLRAFIRYAHERTGIRGGLTQQALAAVGQWEPRYSELIRDRRPPGVTGALAEILGGSAELGVAGIILADLDREVGGRAALLDLDVAPLPDEPFEWAAIPEDIHSVVQQVLDACDQCAEELLDVEHRTAMRRFLTRVAASDPVIFRRKASPMRAAAAVAWVICRANGTVAEFLPTLTVQELLESFGVRGSVSQRAEPMLRAIGAESSRRSGTVQLGTADLLISEAREAMVETRDHWLEMGDES